MEQYLVHYGTPRHSGRYPWGSGQNPQRSKNFVTSVKELRDKGMSDSEIAKSLGLKSSTELRTRYSTEYSNARKDSRSYALSLKNQGYSNVDIGKKMGLNESSVRNLLKNDSVRSDKADKVADVLRNEVEKKPYFDVTSGVNAQLGVSETTMKNAVAKLEQQGYTTHTLQVMQATNPGKYTTVKVLTKDNVPWKEVYQNRDKVSSYCDVYSDDDGLTFSKIKPPVSISSKRITINYAEDGGTDKDGVIEIRRGCTDLSLGQNNYVQTRISVDGTHYLKGMAVYADDLPAGYDIRFNTNKHKGTPMCGEKDNTVLKNIKDDPDNPFGATVRQRNYVDKDGKSHLSPINIVNTDEDWSKWSKNLPSQFLSKQRPELAQKQLNKKYDSLKKEYDEICALTNPTVKKQQLKEFADKCDGAAVDLKAAALPRQATHAILPVKSLKSDQIYAPNYKDGEEVILIRYPHAGTFEIPRLTVNNRNQEGKKVIGPKAKTAVGINSKVAEQLSGADFDGDTVVVIPTKNLKLKTSERLIKDYDPKEIYKKSPTAPRTGKGDGFDTQTEMGKISNLITDMTIKGASKSELARAVKHSMTVIDADKHNLDWRKSESDNEIKSLKAKYQGGENRGASTLISRASSTKYVNKRKPSTEYKEGIDPETGKKVWQETGETYTTYTTSKRTGEQIPHTKRRTVASTKMYEADDAYSLSSGTKIESVYADFANKCKSLGNTARKTYITTTEKQRDPVARKTYKKEVESLENKLKIAKQHAPQERKAQLVTSKVMETKLKDNPDMTKSERTREAARVLATARTRVGGGKKDSGSVVHFTEKEWEAIQNNAISKTMLKDLLANANSDEVKKLAMPKKQTVMTSSKIARAKSLLNAGKSRAEVAEALGVSVTTLNDAV